MDSVDPSHVLEKWIRPATIAVENCEEKHVSLRRIDAAICSERHIHRPVGVPPLLIYQFFHEQILRIHEDLA